MKKAFLLSTILWVILSCNPIAYKPTKAKQLITPSVKKEILIAGGVNYEPTILGMTGVAAMAFTNHLAGQLSFDFGSNYNSIAVASGFYQSYKRRSNLGVLEGFHVDAYPTYKYISGKINNFNGNYEFISQDLGLVVGVHYDSEVFGLHVGIAPHIYDLTKLTVREAFFPNINEALNNLAEKPIGLTDILAQFRLGDGYYLIWGNIAFNVNNVIQYEGLIQQINLQAGMTFNLSELYRRTEDRF